MVKKRTKQKEIGKREEREKERGRGGAGEMRKREKGG